MEPQATSGLISLAQLISKIFYTEVISLADTVFMIIVYFSRPLLDFFALLS